MSTQDEKPKYYTPVEEVQPELLDMSDWKREWQDMPEFNCQDLEPFAIVNVRFASEKDLKDFAKLVGQTIDGKAKAQSIWFPKVAKGQMNAGMSSTIRCVDES